MTTSELIKKLKEFGCTLKRHGAKHDIWYNPNTGEELQVPRHKGEVKTGTAKEILKKANIIN